MRLTLYDGNRNRQGDPPVLSERLLCISRAIWEEILDVVEGIGLVGGMEMPEAPDLEVLVEEEDEQLETVHVCLQINQARFPWWERENWEDVWDEERGWGDLSRNGQRELTKLTGR